VQPRSDAPKDGWDHPAPFVLEVVAGQEDIDSYGHVNNAVYLRWLERCAWAHSESVGLPEATCIAMQRGMAVRHLALDYLAAARLGDRVLVGNWISANDGRLRVSRHFQIRHAERGDTLLRGNVEYVCLNLASGRAVRLPPEFLEGYAVTTGH
jgi:acyl-CoA thioester hydrolase